MKKNVGLVVLEHLSDKLNVHVLNVDLLFIIQHAESNFLEELNLLEGSCSWPSLPRSVSPTRSGQLSHASYTKA